MKFFYYILKNKEPVSVDHFAWARWFQKSDRHVAETIIGKIRISTVFLGLNHQFGKGPPILFETMVFNGSLDGEQNRYHTWQKAQEGHNQMVEFIKKRRSNANEQTKEHNKKA